MESSFFSEKTTPLSRERVRGVAGVRLGTNLKIPNLELPEPLVNRTSNLPNLCLDFKTEPNLKRPNLEP